GMGQAPGGLAFEGVEATGWFADLLGQLQGRDGFEMLEVPKDFRGSLRPYQARGYSWLGFLKRWGFGACLADDMGLGKTVQTLAMVERDWEADPNKRRPTLLVCPMSVVGNWQKEAAKFTPKLPVMVHHGLERTKGAAFKKEAMKHALVLSSFSLLHRDFDLLKAVPWSGVILDEAQNIKNPETKQSKAARALAADYRVALTGTPVENHVGDLWSIMEFLNPGHLGTQAEFKRSFHIPIQVNRDPEAAKQLQRLSGPFILRRLKTDKSIIADLPDKQEMKVYCTLTKEQASLYEAVVAQASEDLDTSEGIRKKGVVLATLSKLKQVCNHPAQFLGDNSAIPGRSGKLARLTEMLDEALSAGDRALVFSQFAEMGEILRRHLQETFGREVLFLHGGTSKKQRDVMVERFQDPSDDAPPIFVLSLKAGGTGLNLTRANHVFHFDRWWNPAVENQATDRAFRIGQTRNVQVHKFLCVGTLEEKIDEMIETKQEVAGSVVGSGEDWLTKLSTAELKDLFKLRREALGE
ncbi:DEAD/DEAH box helicase, partial [Singulisphaera rosea]